MLCQAINTILGPVEEVFAASFLSAERTFGVWMLTLGLSGPQFAESLSRMTLRKLSSASLAHA